MKVLVVFTGGTIGSSINDGIADVDSSVCGQLIKAYENEDIDFICTAPLNILSENSTAQTLSQICNYMLSVDYDVYDGIIVTHGSDTLAYTSALLGIVLSWVKIPVVITAANYVLELPQSNGIANFRASVDFIRGFYTHSHNNCGVFTVWQNPGEAVSVYIATRLNEADGYSDSFSSWGGVPFGRIKDGAFCRIDNEINPITTVENNTLSFLKGKKLHLNNDAVLLHSYPGLDFGAVSLEGKKAALVVMYHSATVCVDGNGTSFLSFVEKCERNNVTVYVCSAKKSEYTYSSSHKMLAKNVIPLYNIGICAAYVKVLLNNTLIDIVDKNMFYESLPDRVGK